MKKKMLTIVIVVIAVIALVFVGWYVMFVHFGRGPAFPFLATADLDDGVSARIPLADDPLLADAGTEEEARKIAEQYGITLVSYGNGIATYQTDEDPYEVIARGEKKGYPKLSINFVQEAFEPTDPIEPTEPIKLTEPIKPTELYNGQYENKELEEKE